MTHVYVADMKFIEELVEELGGDAQLHGNLVISDKLKLDACFALDIWPDAQLVKIASINDAVKILKKTSTRWFANPISCFRRMELISQSLRMSREKAQCFSLLDQNTLVYSTTRTKEPPLGDFQFVEDKKNPPNRAYLKLWEALELFGEKPKAGEWVMDLGASPGGWTWVAQNLGANVIAVDKTALDPKIAALPRVNFVQQSAFAVDLKKLDKPVDWLLSDVACYPDRAYRLVKSWIDSGKAKRLIVTIKLQGKTNLEALKPFQEIPRARVLHLHQNKHEVTFFYPAFQ